MVYVPWPKPCLEGLAFVWFPTDSEDPTTAHATVFFPVICPNIFRLPACRPLLVPNMHGCVHKPHQDTLFHGFTFAMSLLPDVCWSKSNS
jgi:hypothetical protein